MRIFYIAEITGKVGVWAVKKNIAEIKRRYQPDFIIANAGMDRLHHRRGLYLSKERFSRKSPTDAFCTASL